MIDPPFDFVLPPAETGCGYDVLVEATGKFKVIELPGGQTVGTGPGLTATVTNLGTEAAATLNITGALHSSVVDGATVFVAPDRTVSPQAGRGHRTDVCALVA